MQNGVIALCVYIFGEAGVDIARLIGKHSGTAADGNTPTETAPTQPNATGTPMAKQTASDTGTTAPHPREPETHGGTDEPDGQEDEEPPG